ncbi:hypothetical protein FXO38_05716 [Capsicum annuum]|nr:hypothetical protein FXO37_34448 [Capsicum annuum]KAF3673243.1 hypothetical protein FXO38_05716 [Capsicum annuum]
MGESRENGDFYGQRADGIMGFGRGDVSIVDQLLENHVIRDSFFLCYGGMDFGGGVMILVGINPLAHMVFTKSYFGRSWEAAKKNTRVFGGKHGTILDSGTTYAYLPEAAFKAFKSAHFKVCGAYCLGNSPNQKNPTSHLGGIVVHNTLVTYNRENKRIGCRKTNCSEIWDRQNSFPPPPSPSTPVVSGLDNRKSNTRLFHQLLADLLVLNLMELSEFLTVSESIVSDSLESKELFEFFY